jgi:hypothetical protein
MSSLYGISLGVPKVPEMDVPLTKESHYLMLDVPVMFSSSLKFLNSLLIPTLQFSDVSTCLIVRLNLSA